MVLCALLAGRATAAAPVPAFAHVVIVFENKESTTVLGNRAAPTFNSYGRRYAKLTRYYGVTHPSLPNYLALVSGSTQGITTDCPVRVDAKSLADTLEASGRTWKAYAEGLPAPGFLGAFNGRYAKKHNPLAYFRAASPRIRPVARGSCHCPSWAAMSVRGPPSSRSSFPTSVTRCTIARSRSEMHGCAARSGSS